MTDAHPRYRVEDGQHCVDIRLSSDTRLFDNRDPAPFRERDLDPDVVEYLINSAEDLAPHGPFRVVLWFPGPPGTDDLTTAIRGHLDYELERLLRARRRARRTGQVTLLLALVLLLALQVLAQLLVAELPASSARDAVKEGLVILSWVVLWRPIETLIYDWLPVRRRRKLLALLLAAPIDIRLDAAGAPPAPAAS
jgi:hypothetical protein